MQYARKADVYLPLARELKAIEPRELLMECHRPMVTEHARLLLHQLGGSRTEAPEHLDLAKREEGCQLLELRSSDFDVTLERGGIRMHRHDGHPVSVLIEIEAIGRHLWLLSVDERHQRTDSCLELIPAVPVHIRAIDVDDRSSAHAFVHDHRPFRTSSIAATVARRPSYDDEAAARRSLADFDVALALDEGAPEVAQADDVVDMLARNEPSSRRALDTGTHR
jgi:hypothetical protein